MVFAAGASARIAPQQNSQESAKKADISVGQLT